jgi:gliding motility-associated-like protein
MKVFVIFVHFTFNWLHLSLVTNIFMKKIYRILTTVVLLSLFTALSAQVVINEYSAANKNNYANGGKYYDWIELYNTTGSVVNIGGWYLTDDKNVPNKYQIPAGVTIPANGFRIFLCSDLGTFTNGQYHTNFKLTQSDTSEEVLLSNSSLVRIDSVKIFPCDSNDSRGRTTNGAATWSVFVKATPNASNNTQTAYLNYVPKVQFSLPAGFYSGTQSVALSCVLPGVTIRYTTNGSIPTATSTLYSAPINVSSTTVIRARAFDAAGQYAPSFTETNTYFINENHTLPVVSVTANSLNTQLGNGTLNLQFGNLEFFGSNNQQEFEIGGEFSPHGNDSWAYDQRGFDFNIEDEYGTGDQIKEKLFYTSPRKKFKWLIFKAGASDNFPDGGTNPPTRCAHIRDIYNQTLAEKFNLNLDTRRGDHCIVFVNGQYWGVYEYREKVDADYFDYYYNQGEKWVDDLMYWGGLNVKYGSDTAWVNLYNFVVNNSMTVPANYQHVADRLDLLSLIDDVALGIYTVNTDWLNWNTAWWRGRKSPGVKWRYWLWDTDNTFNLGQNYTGWSSTNYTANPCDLSGLGGGTNYTNPNIGANQGHLVIFDRLMQNPNFKSLYINRLGTLLSTAFSCTNMLNHLDTMIARIQPEMQRHCTKWGGSYTQWQQNVQYLRNQISGRCAVFSGGVDSCYNVTGPYPVVVNVSPACAGTVNVGASQTPDQYPYHGTYFGGINFNVKAIPAPGWQFSHWQLVSHTPNPGTTADSIWFDLGTTGDSIVAVFTQVTPTPGELKVIIQGNNPGLVTVNGTPVTNGQVLNNIIYGISVSVSATPITGCTFFRWKLNHTLVYPNDTLETGSFCFRQNDTLYAIFDQCNVVPDSLTVIVQQPGYGTVTINSVPVPAPITVPMNAGTLLNIVATPTTSYTFSHWQVFHHTITPNNTTSTASFTFNQRDTLIAVFLPPDTFSLTVMVNPLPGGNVTVNGTTPSGYPTVLKFVDGTLLNVAALANTGYTFTNWVLLHHTLNPNNTTANASFTITQNDTLLANFTLNPLPPDTFSLTVMVNPLPGGNVTVNGTTPSGYPTVLKFVDGTLLNVAAVANTGYTFTNWVLLHHTLNPNNTTANASFTITQNDTLLANFSVVAVVDTFDIVLQAFPANGGSITVNGTTYSTYPTTIKVPENTVLNFTANPGTGFTFINWHVVYQTPLPNDAANPMNFTATANDTVYAFFFDMPDTFNLTVMNAPAGGGSVTVNGTTLVTYPATLQFQQGTPVNASVLSNTGFTFTNWSVFNHTLVPNNTSANVNFTINTNDTLIANYYVWPDTLKIVVDVRPNTLAGNVKVEGFTPPGYPWAVEVQKNSNVDFEATGKTFTSGNGVVYNYVFERYEFIYHNPIPNPNTSVVFINVQQPDTVIAYFVHQPATADTTAHVLLPTAFSPDGDGKNDIFHVVGEQLLQGNLQIYNRWGQKVFESNNPNDYGWNGEFNNKPCPMGVYAYILVGKRLNGDEIKLKGTVTLLR